MTSGTPPTVEDIRAYLRPFDFFTRYANGQAEGEAYVDAHAARFRETIGLLQPLPAGARILELGAVPYYMTILVIRHLGAVVDPLSFYEVDRAQVPHHEVTNLASGERYVFRHHAVNVERDPLPFAEGGHDVVLCCEILEHLLINPSHMLFEAHRVLKPGGLLLISTPNVLRRANILALMQGRNIYDRYHGNGIYGRHNREYTLAETTALVEACGFTIERADARDVMPDTSPVLPAEAETGREDTLFVLARASGTRRMACPESLYVLMDEYRNVIRPSITMGVDEIGQIGPGWHELETTEARACRWSQDQATFFLRQGGQRTIRLEVCCHHPDVEIWPLDVALVVDGKPAGARQLVDHEWHEVDFTIDPAAHGATLECTLGVSRCWRPKDTGGADTRRLGVRVSRAWLC
jgi:SAM-dependent methyltransferase